MKTLLACTLLLATTYTFCQSTPVCDVRHFGAKGDGTTLDTAAVNAALEACSQQGGGTVFFPAGRYVIGTTLIPSHTHLYLESGAVLLGSSDVHDYLPSQPFGFGRHYGVDIAGEGSLMGMLLAKNAEDISIDGYGEINGQGDHFMQLATPHASEDYVASRVRNPAAYAASMNSLDYGPVEPASRPGVMIVFFHCRNIHLHGITLRQAPNWTLELQDVTDATISDMQILNNPVVPNNDGIDCMQCHHVAISNMHIETGDDDLAIGSSEHVHVTNSSLSSRSAAIRLEGTQLSTFTGLSMETNRGIAIFAGGSKDQGYSAQENPPTEDVTFADIVVRTHLIGGGWWGKAEPIYIAVQPCLSSTNCAVRVRNVTFRNITATAENGALLQGAAGAEITGVEMSGVHLHMVAPAPQVADSIGGNLDLRWTATRREDAIVKSDIPALLARHVDGLRLRDVTVDWAEAMPAYFTDGLRVEDFRDLDIQDYAGRQAQMQSGAAIDLQNGAGVAITNSRALPATQTFLECNHVTGHRFWKNNDVGDAATAIWPAGPVSSRMPAHSPQGPAKKKD